MSGKRFLLPILIISGLILANYSFGAGMTTFHVPDTLEGVKDALYNAFLVLKERMPVILTTIWRETVIPTWQRMFDWFKENIWAKISPRAREELEKRKAILKEEFPKEKEELKKEIPQASKSLWERFKELIK